MILQLALRRAMDDSNSRRKNKIVSNQADEAVIVCSFKFSASRTRKGEVVESQDFYLDVDKLQQVCGEYRALFRESARVACAILRRACGLRSCRCPVVWRLAQHPPANQW